MQIENNSFFDTLKRGSLPSLFCALFQMTQPAPLAIAADLRPLAGAQDVFPDFCLKIPEGEQGPIFQTAKLQNGGIVPGDFFRSFANAIQIVGAFAAKDVCAVCKQDFWISPELLYDVRHVGCKFAAVPLSLKKADAHTVVWPQVIWTGIHKMLSQVPFF